jgi:Cu(I)/Ag(I) efflux system membrane fusion protein
MYADARLKIDLGKILTIPESAVIRSGERDYAFALGTEGQLQPLEVKIGARGDGFYELISGLYEGDKVVTSANFLIDSESSLKAALEAVSTQPAQTTTTTTTGTKPPTQNHSGHTGHSAHTGHSN